MAEDKVEETKQDSGVYLTSELPSQQLYNPQSHYQNQINQPLPNPLDRTFQNLRSQGQAPPLLQRQSPSPQFQGNQQFYQQHPTPNGMQSPFQYAAREGQIPHNPEQQWVPVPQPTYQEPSFSQRELKTVCKQIFQDNPNLMTPTEKATLARRKNFFYGGVLMSLSALPLEMQISQAMKLEKGAKWWFHFNRLMAVTFMSTLVMFLPYKWYQDHIQETAVMKYGGLSRYELDHFTTLLRSGHFYHTKGWN